MKYREKLGYVALGGVLMLIGMLAASWLSPLGAQKDVKDVEWGKITCREIEVIGSEGYPLVIIGTKRGFGGFGYVNVIGYAANVDVSNEGGTASMAVGVGGSAEIMVRSFGGGAYMSADGSSAAGGSVKAFTDDRESRAVLQAGIDSGSVSVSGSGGSASMSVFEDGGRLAVKGEDGKIRFLD